MKTILITGGSSGIGEALALHYARAGKVKLILTARSLEALKPIQDACLKLDADCHIEAIDVRDRAAMHDFIIRMDQTQPLDMVIANAGISAGTGGTSFDETLAQSQTIFDVNIQGVLNTIDPVLPRMVARQQGQIALVSSMASFMALPGAPAYSASKAFVRSYGESLRGAVRLHNVQVSVICPGFVKSRMTAVNTYDMPFLMDAGRAASIIAKDLAQNKGRIAFPWPMYLMAGFGGMLPQWLAEKLFTRLPAKPGL